ncbi:MAG: hypothetical protein Q8941_16445 [Bacteroidota bacterium]|nr:hypothetical protein [Bacteroidota bacterium]
MNKEKAITSRSLIYYRLIALWILNEAMLGGIIHGLQVPVSGLVVGSCAVVCICLIAWYVPAKGAIIKATIIVAIFKMMLSPQAPPPAYIAVFFQGLMGELLFMPRKFYRIVCVLFAVLALAESGLQRILIWTVVYGNDFWKAINSFLNNLTGQKELTDYSYFIITWYVMAHLVIGALIGLWTGILPQQIAFLESVRRKYKVINEPAAAISFPRVKRRKKVRRILFIIWAALILLYAQSYFGIGRSLLPPAISLRILIRSVIVILSWVFIAAPLLKQALNKWLQRRKTRSQQEIQQVLEILPATQQLITKSWQLSGEKKGWRRIRLCCKIILANTFHPADA